MGHGIGVPVGRSFHACAQFSLGELGAVQRVVFRGHATTGEQLDLRSAQHELFTHAAQHFGLAIGNHGDACTLHQAQRGVVGRWDVITEAEVAMAGGLRNHGPAGVDAWAVSETFINRTLEGKGRAACIAHRGEAAQQGALCFLGRDQVQIAEVGRHGGQLWNGCQHAVPVHIDQAGHDQFALTVNNFRTFHRRASGHDVGNALVLDQDVYAFTHAFARAIKQTQIGQQQRALSIGGCTLRHGTGQGKRCQHGGYTTKEAAP